MGFMEKARCSLILHSPSSFNRPVLSLIASMFQTIFSGFIMMTPQLFINYKLKSVAHLPWRMLTYKALNTFIDDIFAFVIKMPTLYRIGCLRDGKSYYQPHSCSYFLPWITVIVVTSCLKECQTRISLLPISPSRTHGVIFLAICAFWSTVCVFTRYFLFRWLFAVLKRCVN